MHWINKVVANHSEWVKMVNTFGEEFFAEDIVQETYLMLLKWSSEDKLYTKGKINKGYVWLALKNTFLMHVNKSKKITLIKLDNVYNVADENTDEENEGYNSLLNNLDAEMKTWHWYDQQLFDVYKNTKISLRIMSQQSRISVTSIFNTITTCKHRIKQNVGEDYEDFKNGDYELIKRK